MSVTPIPLIGSQGIFTRIGAFGGLLNTINLSRGTTVPANVTEINNQYVSTDQNIINSLYSNLSSYQNSAGQFNSPIRTMTTNTVIQMANESLLLNNKNISTALNYLIAQMKSTGQTVQSCTVGSSVAYDATNVGNPHVVISMNDVNNLAVENCFAELCTAIVTRDSQSSPSLAGREIINLQGQFSITDTFSYLYPQGSGISLNLQAVSGMTNGGSGTSNWLLNGSMESWSPTSNGTPVNWHIGTGTPGTTILQSTNDYDGVYALQYLGNGIESTAIYQQFSTPAANFDTPAQIQPNLIFAFNAYVQVSGTPAAGVLRFALTDGTNPILDNSGSPNQVLVDLTTLTNVYVPISGVFRTPNQNPATIRLEIKLTTPITNGYSVYIDRIAFAQMTRCYAGGFYISIFSGNVNLIQGDTLWATISNNYFGKFQQLFNKLFSMNSLGLILPSSNSPTISDSLIT